jgi:hypothetical protein
MCISNAKSEYFASFPWLHFVSGTGILLSKKAVEVVISSDCNQLCADEVADDVAIAAMLKKKWIFPQQLFSEFAANKSRLVEGTCFYRFRDYKDNRTKDIPRMESLRLALLWRSKMLMKESACGTAK